MILLMAPLASGCNTRHVSLRDQIERKGDNPVAHVEHTNMLKIGMKDAWKGLLEIKGDIVHFSDDKWETDSE